ncbi:MAG: hypothetical protein ACM3JC_03385 [Rudaea sp.]
MKKLIVTLVAATFAAGSAFAVSAADEQDFAERFAQMQVQSGAAFPHAPLYKGTRKIAAEPAVSAEKAVAARQKRSDFADRFAEMQRESGAKFVTAPRYEGSTMTALAEKEGDAVARPR